MDKYSLLDKERKTNPAAAQLKFSAIFSGVVFNWRIFDTVVSPLRLLKSWRQLLQFPALPVPTVPIASWQIQLFGHIWKCCSWKNYSCWGIVTFFWLMLFCPIIQLKIPPPFSLPMETKRRGDGQLEWRTIYIEILNYILYTDVLYMEKDVLRERKDFKKS